MDNDDPHSEQLAQAWAAAGASNPVSQANMMADHYGASTSNMVNNLGGPGNGTIMPPQPPPFPPTTNAAQLPPFEPAIPQRRRLPSYVSEPPSTLLALSMMAEEEAAAHEKADLEASPFSTTPASATATAAGQDHKGELKSEILTLRNTAWMHKSPEDTTINNKNPVFGGSHARTEPGDLAGAELRQRRRPPPIRLASFNAPRSLSPSRTIKAGSVRSAGGGPVNPKTRISNIQGLHRRRDAEILFADSKSDSDDDDDGDSSIRDEKNAKVGGGTGTGKGGGTGSPRSDTLQEGKLGSEFDIEVPLSKPKRPFYRRRHIVIFFLFTLWSLAFTTAGVCLLVFRASDDTTKLQAWRLCFFVAGLPVIWYIGDFVSQMIVWAVERSMFTVKNALYFAYAVRKPLRNVIRALLTLGWWPLITTVEYTGQQSDGAVKAYIIVLKLWACVTLFMVANLIKVLLGKILALKFNKESHLNKMYMTLKKEQWLHCLLVPRQSYAEAGLLEGGEGAGRGGNDGGLTYGGSGGLAAFSASGRRVASGLGGRSSRIFSKFRMSRSASAGEVLDNGGGGGGGDSTNTIQLKDNELYDAGDDDHMVLESRTSSGGGFSDKFKFWRKSSTPLEIISEESISHVEMSSGTTSGTASGSKPTFGSIRTNTNNKLRAGFGSSINMDANRQDISITIDGGGYGRGDGVENNQVESGGGGGGGGSGGGPTAPNLAKSTSLPPVRTDNTGANPASPRLQRTSVGPVSPLPPRAAIDAAYAAQKKKTSTSTKNASPSKHHQPQHQSLRSTTTVESLTSARHTATTLQQHNKDIAVGAMPDFGSGPLRRDEVMTRLARLERYIRKTNLEVTFRDALNNVEKSEVTSESEAKRVGLFLFWNVKSDFEKSAISKEDLEEFIPNDDDVDDVYDMLDDDGDGKVTLEDCVSAVQTIYQERSNLAASLKDTRSIAGSLEVMIGVIIHLIFIMVYFYILFAVTFNQIWAFVSTVVLGLSFIFGQYIRQLFENTMFLFNSHPFDVGDMLFMDNDFLTVDEIQLNFTVCINSSKQRLWVPNQRLVTNPFINLTTSGNRTESIIILVDMDTPGYVLDDVIAAMEILKEEMPQEYSAVGGSFRDAAVPMKMTLKLFYDFTHNGTNLSRCARARSRMYICVAAALQKAGVTYTWPAMRTLNLPASGTSSNVGAAAVVGAAAGDPNTAPTMVGVL